MKLDEVKKFADSVETLSKRFDVRVARKDADHPKVTALRKYAEGVEGNLAGKSLSELTDIRKELWDKEREASSGEDGSVMNAVQKATKSANKAVEVALSKARGEGGKIGREVQRPRPRTGKYR